MQTRSQPYSTLLYKQRLLGTTKINKSQLMTSKKRKLSAHGWQSSSKKCHSRNSSVGKKSRSKSKHKQTQSGPVTKFLLQHFDIRENKKVKKVAYIPECIKFKQQIKQKQNLTTGKSLRRKKKSCKFGKENKQNNSSSTNAMAQMLPNRDLLKACLKPNKVNFMNRISNVYDLAISKVMLPQFIQYFLGQALFAITRQSKGSGPNMLSSNYDWRLDQFKAICEKIYENSEEEDLKHFMALSLPTINKWNSRPASTKNTITAGFNTVITTHTDSRVSQSTSVGNRIGYFKSLNRKDRVALGQERESIDILDKLNSKLDNYLRNNYKTKEAKKQINEALSELVVQKGGKRTAFSTIFDNRIQ